MNCARKLFPLLFATANSGYLVGHFVQFSFFFGKSITEVKKSLAKKRVGCEKFITSWLKKIHYLLYYFTMLRHKLKFSWRLFVPGENPKWKSVLNNEPFTWNDYMVQKAPCWTANETVGPWKKGYFVLNDEISFFLLLLCVVCQKARCFLYHVTISCEGLIVDLEKKTTVWIFI